MELETTGPLARPYRDRHVGLVCFGALEILLGLMALLVLLSLAFAGAMSSMAAARTPGLTGRTLLPSACVYLLAAVFFIWMGIGSILARRWARALMLIFSWFWLVVGVVGLLSVIWMYPALREHIVRTPAVTANPAGAPGMTAMVLGCMLAVFGVLYVLLPLAFVLFYRSPHVKATCEARDPHPRWTDRCPLPVLGLSLLEGGAAIMYVCVVAVYHVFMFLGFILTGLPAVALGLALAVLLGALARATYRLAPWAWWAAVAFWGLGAVSVLVMAVHPVDWQELYRLMGFDSAQLEQLGIFWKNNQILWLSCIGFLPWAFYLVWARRFFFAPGRPPAPAVPAAP
jgi:hypothetical protein